MRPTPINRPQRSQSDSIQAVLVVLMIATTILLSSHRF